MTSLEDSIRQFEDMPFHRFPEAVKTMPTSMLIQLLTRTEAARFSTEVLSLFESSPQTETDSLTANTFMRLLHKAIEDEIDARIPKRA